MTGPKNRYRGKVYQVRIRLSPVGKACLDAGCHRTGLSQGDYVESLLKGVEDIGEDDERIRDGAGSERVTTGEA